MNKEKRQRLNKLLFNLCSVQQVNPKKVLTSARDAHLADIRHAFAIRAKDMEEENYTLEEIGDYLNRDHSTIVHHLNKRPETEAVQRLVNSDLKFLKDLQALLYDPNNENLRKKLKRQL